MRPQAGDKGAQTRPAVFFLRLRDPPVPHADHQAPKQAQRVRGVGRAHAAAVFIQRGVEPLVEAALDAPVIPPRHQNRPCVPASRRRTGQEQ